MRLLWASNAPWSSASYGIQTRLFVPRLTALGHDIAIATNYGLEGGMLRWGGCQLYPRGRDLWSQDVLAAHAHHFGADALLTLCELQACEPAAYTGIRHWLAWFPVDHEPLIESIRQKALQAHWLIVPSLWGQRVAELAGIDAHYVPFGVDQDSFKIGDRREARKRLGLPEDRWIVGMVADNKDPLDRKAFCAQIAAFAELQRQHSDTLLYLHTNDGHDGRGLPLREIVHRYGLSDDPSTGAIRFCDQYLQLMGLPEHHMTDLYCALDVLLAVSSCEGFGVPLIEAQSCGTPVITAGWTAMRELMPDGFMVEESEPRWHPQRGCLHYPSVAAIRNALRDAYGSASQIDRQTLRERVDEYDATNVTRTYWKPLLEQVEHSLASEAEPTPPPLRELVFAGAAS